MRDQWRKILEFINKTGEKIVVFDQESQKGFVVMDLDSYEKRVLGKSEVKGLTEDELLDKINQDIATWQALQKPRSTVLEKEIGEIEEVEDEDMEDQYYIEPVE
ncbi:MAG TPA: hypothetical protein VKP03_01060 [Patescibacteria group bacterium]|nr:hypothetical protein [Patescibacteria group bacterium]